MIQVVWCDGVALKNDSKFSSIMFSEKQIMGAYKSIHVLVFLKTTLNNVCVR